MSEVRVIAKYHGHAGCDVRVGGLTDEQVDRVLKTLSEVTEERFPGRRAKP